jgi:oligosaccharide repeat unit polymerase
MNTTTNNILKWAIISGLFFIPFIPFVVSKSLLFPFITGKGFTFRIITEIIFGLWAILALSDVQYRPKWNLIAKSICVFVAVVLLADLFSKFPYKSLWSNYERMEGFVTIVHLALYYFVLSGMFKTSLWWKRFIDTNIIASVILACYGFLQLAGKITINQGGVRLDATFGNASYLAIYMVFSMFFALLLLYREKNKIWQWMYGVAFIMQAVVLYYTATRGAILGFIGGILITALVVAWKEKENKALRKMATWLLGAVIVVVLLFITVRNTSFVQNSPVLSRFATLSVSDLQTQGRYYVWPMALKGVAERPILGWGQESFNYVFNKFYNPAMYNQEQWFDRTHDIFLDWLINAGVVGLLSYISLYAALLYILWAKPKGSPEHFAEQNVLGEKSTFSIEEKGLITGLMLAYIFHNIFVFDNLISYIMFFTVLAWVGANSQQVEHNEQGIKPPMNFSSETLNYFLTPLIVIIMVGSIYFVNVPAILASQSLIGAISNQTGGPQVNLDNFKKAISYNSFGSSEILEQLVGVSTQIVTAQSVSGDVRQGFLTLTTDQITKKIKETPDDARYLLLAGSFFNRVGQYDTAIPYLTDAVKNSPTKSTMYFELGSSYLGKSDYPKALDIFAQGYNLEQNNPDAQAIYAIGGIYNGKTDIIKEMFAKLGQDKVMSDDRILQTYVNIKDYTAAINILTYRVLKDPTNYNTELNLASVYASAGQKTKAIQIIQDVEGKNPTLKAQLDTYIQQLSK